MGLVSELIGRRFGWLARLRRSKSGNTLAMLAIGIVPLAGLVGGAVDASRLYITKTRLQHACDAGALAGRKQMGGGTWAFSNNQARTVANEFFDANFQDGDYGSEALERTFTERAGRVMGLASAEVPMTLMKIFDISTQRLEVTCDAEMRLPNTDVMFVLDVTGSMASRAAITDTESKIVSLRRAVKCFYEIVARLDTDADCDGGEPSGGTGDTVQIRFGFVPYNTNVNVGRLLPTAYMPDTWSYQSREPQFSTRTETGWSETSSGPGANGTGRSDWGEWADFNTDRLACLSRPADQSNTAGSITVETAPVLSNGGTVRTWEMRRYTRKDVEYRSVLAGLRCKVESRERGTGSYTTTQYRQTLQSRTTTEFARWRYALVEHNISALKNGTNRWNGSLELPIGKDGDSETIEWDGCIEERQTVTGTNFTPIPAGAYDLNIDMKPSSGDRRTLWGPALHEAIFTRHVNGAWTRNEVLTPNDGDQFSSSAYWCPTPATKLREWRSASQFDDYVDSLEPDGQTYHDIGMLWGARLMSPTGIFDTENRLTNRGAEIERHLIFMTDGDTVTNNFGYSAYGVPWYDRRNVANPNGAGQNFNNEVNARFAAICSAVKNMNITLWVISFGNGSNVTTEKRLEDCATDGRFFTARDSSALQATFRRIADEISQLRLTQ